MRRAKILATLGPSSDADGTLENMIGAGLNAVRINMSHGSYEEHERRIKSARAAAAKEQPGAPVAFRRELLRPRIEGP
jgi:pyruvate kinase